MNDSVINIKYIIRIIAKRKILVLFFFILTIFLATIINSIIPEVYEAETTVRIKQPKGLANSLLADQPMEISNTKQLMQANTEILKSRTVAQAVVLKLSSNQYSTNTITPGDIMGRISTIPVNAEILRIKVKGKKPEEAQIIANALIDTFVKHLTNLSRVEQKIVREFIGERLLEAKGELETVESALENYKRSHKIVSPNEETRVMVEKLAGMKRADDENNVALVSNAARLNNIREKLNKQKQGVFAENQLIQQQKSKLAELELEKASLLAKYTDEYPKVISIQATIDQIKTSLDTEIIKVVNGDSSSTNPIYKGLLENEITVGAELSTVIARQEIIKKIIAQDEQEIAEFPAKEHGLAIVERDVTIAREKYAMLAKRHEEARISEVMQPLEVQVIDPPEASLMPIAPKKSLNLFLGATLGLVGGIGLAVLLELLQKKIVTEEDVKNYLDLPVIGVVADFSDQPRSGYIGYRSKLKNLFRWLNGK